MSAGVISPRPDYADDFMQISLEVASKTHAPVAAWLGGANCMVASRALFICRRRHSYPDSPCYRDNIEDLLAERGLDVSYETVRRWVLKFGPAVAQKLRHARPKPDGRWHLDEMVVLINGQQMYLWRAVDSEGQVLDMLVQPRRDKAAAMKLLRKLLKRSALPAHVIVIDKVRSYAAALSQLGFTGRHDRVFVSWQQNIALFVSLI